ncbi:MAG: ComEA family DNA-binding protein [Lachnospiraceae bacterium]|nr:ComEA family DNA-binding protein [Lachnospiraceae bacterium]
MRNRKYNKIVSAICGLFLGVLCLASGCTHHDATLVIPQTVETGNDVLSVPADVGTVAETYKESYREAEEAFEQGSKESEQKRICVYVCGAVEHPGVVELPEGSRVADALRAAGGFAPDAREDLVNLAEWIQDGQMLRFPGVDEVWIAEGEGKSDVNGRIDINTADIAQLTALNGIGNARAQDIVTYREAHGRFETIEDIKKVPGIKDSIFEKISDQITVRE